MSTVILGIGPGKNACSVVGVDPTVAVVMRRLMRRQTLIDYVAKLPACVVAIEACCGAITWDAWLRHTATRAGCCRPSTCARM